MNDMKSRASRKVAVLGPIPRDQIVTHAGERFHKYGCVMYTAVALSALLDAGDTIVPISHVCRQDRVHEARLPLDATILVDITQLDHVPLVGPRRYTGGVDIREGPQDLLDRTLVPPADV